MSTVSQLTIVIIHHASILGLVISGLLSLILTDKRKKLLFLFLFFLFVGVLSFVYYSAVLSFIIGILMVFFFVSLYLLIFQMELFGSKTGLDESRMPNGVTRNVILNIVLPLLFCAAAGYLIYNYTYDFLKEVTGSGNIFIAGLSDISKKFLTDYGLILIIIIASLFISFLWLIVISQEEK